MTTGGKRGAKQLTARDWLFGSRPRRLALALVLSRKTPAEGWTKTELAGHCEVGARGGVDEHVQGLVALGVLEKRGARYVPAMPRSMLGNRVARLLAEIERIPEVRIAELLEARRGVQNPPRRGRATQR